MSATITAGYPSFDPSMGSGYISNGELLAWLSEVTGDKWDEMRELMVGTNTRHEVMKDLEELRSAYDNAGEIKDTSRLGQVLQDLIEKYEGTPYEQAIKTIAQPRLDAINAVYDAYATRDAMRAGDVDAETLGSQQRTADNLNDGFVDQLDTMGKEVERMGDQLGRDDQMVLIRIQELKDNISQQVNLTSNLIKADDESKSAIVMNLKG